MKACPGVPSATIAGMVDKAKKLLQAQTDVTAVPRPNKRSHFVISNTKPGRPHLVTTGNMCGQFSCELSCGSWAAYKIYSHVIAVAEYNGELLNMLQNAVAENNHRKLDCTCNGYHAS